MSNTVTKLSLESILGLTAFAAGTVDIVGFTGLGGIFPSAMTGNLALLALYLGRFALRAAFGSFLALVGFVLGSATGTLLGRGRQQFAALKTILGVETLLLAIAVFLWWTTQHHMGQMSTDVLILLLSVSMGLQSIVGKKVNLSNIPTIVFTSTLTNIVIALTDMLASGKYAVPKDTKRQSVSFLLYFAGALTTGLAVYLKWEVLIFLPLAASGLAFAAALADSD